MPSQPQPARGSFDAYVQDIAHVRGAVRMIVQRIAYDPDPAVRERFPRDEKRRREAVFQLVDRIRYQRQRLIETRNAMLA